MTVRTQEQMNGMDKRREKRMVKIWKSVNGNYYELVIQQTAIFETTINRKKKVDENILAFWKRFFSRVNNLQMMTLVAEIGVEMK